MHYFGNSSVCSLRDDSTGLAVLFLTDSFRRRSHCRSVPIAVVLVLALFQTFLLFQTEFIASR